MNNNPHSSSQRPINYKYDKSQLAVDTYETIADVYTQKYFDDLSDNPYVDKFLEKLPPKAKILDCGCGPGELTKYMMNQGFSVIGVDLSNQMLANAKKMVPRGEFIKADMRQLPFAESTFDGILVAYSLIHISSEEIPATLNGFNRVLKPAGHIEIIAQKGKPDMIVDQFFAPKQKMFFNFFTTNRITDFLTHSGFEVVYQSEIDSLDPDSASDKTIYTIALKK